MTLSKGSPLPFEQKELKPVVARSLGFFIFMFYKENYSFFLNYTKNQPTEKNSIANRMKNVYSTTHPSVISPKNKTTS